MVVVTALVTLITAGGKLCCWQLALRWRVGNHRGTKNGWEGRKTQKLWFGEQGRRARKQWQCGGEEGPEQTHHALLAVQGKGYRLVHQPCCTQ